MTITKVLPAIHTSFETAYVVDSYPYGSLRTEYRIWIETKKGKGQRVVTCTLNPKTNRYNKPHAGTYSLAEVLFLDEIGHVHNDGMSPYNYEAAEKFLNDYSEGLPVDLRDFITQLKAAAYANKAGFSIMKDRKEFYTKIDEILKDWGREDLAFLKK